MSEFIDNVEESPRVNALLAFVRQVHEGTNQDRIEAEYEDTIQAVTPYDVLVVEHTLLGEGVSHTQLKENIEPILETLAPSLQAYEWEKPGQGHPIDNFQRENQAIESHVETLGNLAEELKDISAPPIDIIGELRDHIDVLEAIDLHFVRKENELFPHLEAHWKHHRSLGVMWSIHDDIRSLRSTIGQMLTEPGTNPNTLSTLLSRFEELLRGLIFKEEYIVFPVAMETLATEQWAQIQRESREIGYFEIDPQFGLIDETASETGETVVNSQPEKTGNSADLPPGSISLGLQTGTLELDELQRLLDTIPVDVTYVDENGRVRYFNNHDDRIFPRSGSIIGRTVQNCHPPESMDKVEEILTTFRAGEEDKARFWIQMEDAFVVIEYFAMRDQNDAYRGTLEVTREVSDIRSLEGEQRLIDWG